MTASRAIQNRVFTRARKNLARISHVSIFQSVGTAHAHPSKHPRKHTPGSGAAALEFPKIFRVFLAACGFSLRFPPPKNGAKTKTDAFRNPLARGAQQTAVV
jgi:hypothetical protein